MDQIERIKQMESYLVKTQTAYQNLLNAFNAYEKIQKDYQKLSEYYSSVDWKNDFLADEEDRLPNDLKRGVLSEDAVFNLLSDTKALNKHMLKVIPNFL